ncbi:sugar ABC transporter substrate-binding protein [soil metagenome]
MNPNRFVRSMAIATVAAVVFAACGTSTATVAPSAGATSGPVDPSADARQVELSYANWFYQGSMEAVWNEYIESYKAKEPRVTNIRVETQPFTRYNDVLNVQLAAGDPPDVSWINASVGPQYVTSGRLVDLTPYIPADYDLEDFGSALDPWTHDGKLYALPFTNANNVLYFNKDLFAAAGLKTPIELQAEGNWTWETLKETSRQLVEAGVAEFGFHLNGNIFTQGWRNLVDVWAPYGGGPWSADGRECRFNAPETVEATQLVWDMIYTDKSHPGPAVVADFAAGNVGMALARQNFVPRLADVPFGWDVTVAPDGPLGYVTTRAQNAVAAFADAENPDLAAGFVVHAMSAENAVKFGANTPAVRKSLQTLDLLEQFNPNFTREQLERAMVPSLNADQFQMEYTHTNYAAAEKASILVFDSQLWKPDADVKAALDQACNDVAPFMNP